jgi:hypothetical protein
MTKLKIVLILAMLIFSGCNRSVKDRIIHYMDSYCEQEKGCIMNLNNLVPFEWDTMFIFGANADQNFIEATIQCPYHEPDFLHGERKIIFTYGRHVVYEEAYPVSKLNESFIDFSSIKDSVLRLRGYAFHVNEAIFYVYKERLSDRYPERFVYHLLTVNPS